MSHEWNCHIEIFSRPQVIENSKQYLLLRTDILQETVLGYVMRVLLRFKWTFLESYYMNGNTLDTQMLIVVQISLEKNATCSRRVCRVIFMM